MQNLSTIKKVVEATLTKSFDYKFKVYLEEDEDTDGDRIVRINIVFEGTLKDSDMKKLNGTLRMLRNELDKKTHNNSLLPLLSFISKSDYARAV